jgi:vacuolar-type H+-ATPase subunit H
VSRSVIFEESDVVNDNDDEYDEPFVEEPFDPRSEEGDDAKESPNAEGLLLRAVAVLEGARTMPLSASVLVSREELLELVQGALDRLPDEMRQARWLLRERDEFIEARRREADALLEEVRAQAERMVQRTEIVREANKVAQRIVEEAREQARRLRHEAEDYCDQKLASFEIVLGRTLKTVLAGREKLLATTPPPYEGEGAAEGPDGRAEEPDEEENGEFFDQDDG